MKLMITVFKESGKFYANNEVESNQDIALFQPEFKDFIKNNLPAKIEDGFVIVQDMPNENQGFHIKLYRMSELD